LIRRETGLSFFITNQVKIFRYSGQIPFDLVATKKGEILTIQTQLFQKLI